MWTFIASHTNLGNTNTEVLTLVILTLVTERVWGLMPHLQSQEIFRNIWQFKRYFAIEKRDKSLTPKLKHFNVSRLEKSDFLLCECLYQTLISDFNFSFDFKVLAGLKINLFTEVSPWSHWSTNPGDRSRLLLPYNPRTRITLPRFVDTEWFTGTLKLILPTSCNGCRVRLYMSYVGTLYIIW